MDKRITKTKGKLRAALEQILEQKPLHEISISELCAKAQINRSTFYIHYGNVGECFNELSDEILSLMKSELAKCQVIDAERYLRVYYQTARIYPGVFRSIHSTSIYNPLIQKIVDLSRSYIQEDFGLHQEGNFLFYQFMLSGFYGMTAAWLNNGCKESDQILIENILKIQVRQSS